MFQALLVFPIWLLVPNLTMFETLELSNTGPRPMIRYFAALTILLSACALARADPAPKQESAKGSSPLRVEGIFIMPMRNEADCREKCRRAYRPGYELSNEICVSVCVHNP